MSALHTDLIESSGNKPKGMAMMMVVYIGAPSWVVIMTIKNANKTVDIVNFFTRQAKNNSKANADISIYGHGVSDSDEIRQADQCFGDDCMHKRSRCRS